jgi:superfamily I DNA/RNA helicase
MLVGDAGQRIYPGGFSLNRLGIEVRGRSQILRINYRTTEQIRRAADRVLGFECDDMDEGTELRSGTRSVMRGPEPDLRGFGSDAAEEEAVVAQIEAWLADGLEAEEIGVFSRGRNRVEKVANLLRRAGYEACLLQDQGDTPERHGVQLGTMHRAKGLEFKAVLVMGCGARYLPNYQATHASDDPQDREDAVARERRLLYVAMTRARDRLAVTWAGKPSPFLAQFVAAPAEVDA